MVQKDRIQDTEILYTVFKIQKYRIQDTEVQYSGNRNAVYRNTVSMKQIYSSDGTEIPYTGYRNTPYSYRIQKYRIATGYTSTVYRIQDTEEPYQSYELHATFSLKPFSKSNRKC